MDRVVNPRDVRPSRRRPLSGAVLLLCLAAGAPGCRPFDPAEHLRAIPAPPPEGMLYHGAFPGNASGREDDVTLESIRQYEQLTGAPLAWVYFSHDWFRDRQFPAATARMIRDAGSVPFIRLMLRSDARHWHAESTYTLQRILHGEFDGDLRTWFRSAREFGSPLIVEYGTEVNGEWFSWNGLWNGGEEPGQYGSRSEPDGPERFRDAYRHIISLCRNEGAANVLWVFHVNSGDAPNRDWNRLERYFPGPEWVDWIGVSVYGAQKPQEKAWPQFRDLMNLAYPRLTAMAPTLPLVVCEFGATQGNPLGAQEVWAAQALHDLCNATWPRVIGFAWWNEGWRNDTDPRHDTNFRLQDNEALAKAFREVFAGNPRIQGRILAPPGTSR